MSLSFHRILTIMDTAIKLISGNLVAEDGVSQYVTEDGASNYVTET